MYHHCHWKATVCILFSNCSFLLSKFPHSAVAFRLQGPRHFVSKQQYSPIPFRHSIGSPLNLLKDAKENIQDGVNDKTMIVRVRSNLGTVKLTIKDEETATEATIRAKILEDLLSKTSIAYQLTQDLSFDPAGARKIDGSKTLSEQGIQHGSMVYCRVTEETLANNKQSVGDNVLSTKNLEMNKKAETANAETANAEKAGKEKDDGVIDLVDSSDEEETHDDDDEVQVISPQKIKKNSPQSTTELLSIKNRKRPRTSSNGDSNSEKAARKDTMMGGSYPSFQMASYNVWFGPPDPEAGQVFPKERMEGIVKSLKESVRKKKNEQGKMCPLLFVGLQELTPNLVQFLEPSFRSIGYKMCTQPLGGFGPSYGIGIAVPEDLNIVERRFVPYRNSMQGRGFLFVRTPTLLFATTHLESWCGPQMTGSKEREVQIVEAADFCREQLLQQDGLELAMIAGDLNWDDERKRKPDEAPNRNLLSILPDGWQDAGTPFDFTYDAKENPMLNGNLRRRFDRCIYITRQNYRSSSLEKIGKKSIPNLVWNKRNSYNNTVKKMPVAPSDHFGIVVHFLK